MSEGAYQHEQGIAGDPAAGRAEVEARLRLATQDAIAAIDLGTNNCRLLVAEARGAGFRVVDSFARIVRLGEGLAQSGRLSEVAIERAVAALSVCAERMKIWNVQRSRVVATEACRRAENGAAFVSRVQAETGLSLEIISPAEEARLAVAGCTELMDNDARGALVFDIGGGSTELVWVVRNADGTPEIAAWTSLSLGVVNLAEQFDGVAPNETTYRAMVDRVRSGLASFEGAAALKPLFASDQVHHLGISGTVTTLASLHLGLRRYQRHRIDGLWLSDEEVKRASESMRSLSFRQRADNACIGLDRADLVIPGCAILDAIREMWPTGRLRVADRGLREGMLIELIGEPVLRRSRRRPSGRRRRARTAARALRSVRESDGN